MAFAGAATAVLLVGVAAVGGLGYAASAVERAVDAAKEAASPGSVTIANSSGQDQYRPGKGCGDKNHIHERRHQCKMKINDVRVKEGDSGPTAAVFTVSLSDFAIDEVTALYATAGGTATPSADYVPTAGTLRFAPGQSIKTITVTVVGDTQREPDETFYVNLSDPSPNAVIIDGQGEGVIRNDDR
ncbi:MAG TPA: Calx-beta domain-containing protein [Gaiellaceae bacterium]|nr:Calx-beta domain-containing protein [Gaiellaceae bacterium]